MLQEADSGLTAMAMAGQQGRYQGDEFLLVRFFLHPRHHPQKSAEEGRPVYIDTPYISIMQPGNKDSIVIRPATSMDKNRFAEHWRKFQARTDENEEHIEGTLLSEWPGVTRAQVEELRYLNVRTVEQLANLSDSNSQGIMGIQLLKTKAKKYLEAAEKSATAEALADLQAKYDELVAAASKEQASLVEEAPRKRGRPKKSEEDTE